MENDKALPKLKTDQNKESIRIQKETLKTLKSAIPFQQKSRNEMSGTNVSIIEVSPFKQISDTLQKLTIHLSKMVTALAPSLKEKIDREPLFDMSIFNSMSNHIENMVQLLSNFVTGMERNDLSNEENRREQNKLLENIADNKTKQSNRKGDKKNSKEGIFDTIKGVLGGILAASGINKLASVFKSLLPSLKIFGASLSKLILPITLLIGVIGGVIKGIEQYKIEGLPGAIKGFIEGFLDSTIGFALDALGAFIKGLGSLVGLGDETAVLVDTIKLVYETTISHIKNLIDIVVGLFRGDKEMLKTAWKNTVDGIIQLLKTIVTEAVPALWEMNKKFYGALWNIFNNLVDILITEAWPTIRDLVPKLVTSLNTMVGTLNSIIVDDVIPLIWERLKEGVAIMGSGLKSIFIDAPLLAKEKVTAFFSDLIPDVLTKIKEGVSNAFSPLIEFFANLPKAIESAIKATTPGGLSPQEAFIQSLQSGLVTEDPVRIAKQNVDALKDLDFFDKDKIGKSEIDRQKVDLVTADQLESLLERESDDLRDRDIEYIKRTIVRKRELEPLKIIPNRNTTGVEVYKGEERNRAKAEHRQINAMTSAVSAVSTSVASVVNNTSNNQVSNVSIQPSPNNDITALQAVSGNLF